jgi:hypothetical protein
VFPLADPKLGLAARAPADRVVRHPERALRRDGVVLEGLPRQVRPEGLDGGRLALAAAVHRLHHRTLENNETTSVETPPPRPSTNARRIGVCERKRKRNATRHNDGTVTRSTEKTGVQSAAKRLSSRFVSLATVGVVRVGFSTANWLGKSLRSCGKFGRSVACEN